MRLFFLSILLLLSINLYSQVNLALSATASHGGGSGASGTLANNYYANLYNDNNIPACGTSTVAPGEWGWVSEGGWILFQWTSAVTVNQIRLLKGSRPMTSATFEYWNGTSYVAFYAYSNATTCDHTILFPSITTTRIRINNVNGSISPNHREIQILSTCSSAPAPANVSNNGPRCPGSTVNLTAAGLAPGGNYLNLAGNGNGSDYISTVSNNFTIDFWVNPSSTRVSTTQSNSGTAGVNPSSRWVIYPWHGGVSGNNRAGVGVSVGTNGVSVGEHADGYLPTNLVWNGVISGWTHIAIVYNNRTPSLYINGSLVHTGTISAKATVYPSTGSNAVASYGPYSGGLDNVRYWNRVLTAAEIQTVRNYEVTPASVTGLVRQYKFNGNQNDFLGSAVTWGTTGSYPAANYYNYTWSGPGTLPASSTNETQTATLPNTPGPWSYTVSATVGTGCTSTNLGRTMVLSNQSTPPLKTSLSNIGTCNGASVAISVNEPTRRGGEIDRTTWTAGSGAAPGFNLNGVTNENYRLNMTNPWGNTAIGWEARPIVGSPTDADGGWNGDLFPIDNSKIYRFSVWVKRSVVGDGRFYLGLNGFNNATNTGVVRLSTGATETNPYFYHGVDFKQDEWMLVVGHVFPYTHNGTTLHPQSGVYKLNGDVLPILDDYKWLANSTHALHRSYLYYTANAATRQQFMYPRVDVLDGSEPSIQDLLNGFDQNGGLTSSATWQWFNGSCGATSAGSGNTISVAPTSDARYFVRAQDACGTSVCKEATIVIGPTPTVPTIIADGSTTICPGNEVELKGRSNIAGGALSFNGTSDFVDMGNPPDVKVTKNVTIEMWLKPTSFAGRRNPINKAYGGEYTFTLESNGTMNCYFGLMGGNGTPYMGFNSVTPLVLNQWNHIAFVREDNTLRFYVNGVQTSAGLGSPDPTSYVFTTPLTGAQSSENLMLGNGYAGYYAGEMDEVRIWKIARTAAQIASNMNRSITPGSPDLVGYWRFDEASGTAVLDASGKSQTGIMGGSTTRVSNSLAPIKPNFTWAPMASLTTLTDSTVRATPTATTIYSLVATSAHGCNSLTSTQTITLPATAAALSNHLESATCVVKNNNWTHFQHSSGRLIASIQASYPNPNTTITSTSYVSGSPTSVADCQNPSNASLNTAAMQRNWVINATPAIAGNVIVRLYFNNSELSALSAAANSNSNPSDDVNSRSDLQLTKYSGSNQDGIFGDNTTCGWSGALPTTAISRHSQTANGVTSYGSVANSQYVDFTISSFSELWLHGSANVSPLPVELLYFLGNCENGISQLVWSTASEQNNAFFIVERSKDGTNWEFVERVSGAGNSNAQLMYQVSDKKANGANYYRLSQQDYDGTIEVFASIYVACQNAEQNTITVYPNPASENINVAIYVNNDYFNSIIKLMDATGKTVYTAGLDLEKGNNNFSIPLLSLASGTYFLQVLNDKMVLPTQKIIIR